MKTKTKKEKPMKIKKESPMKTKTKSPMRKRMNQARAVRRRKKGKVSFKFHHKIRIN